MRAPLAEATFASAQYPSLEALVQDFLEQADLTVNRASLGVAGPVVGGRAEITNLPWVIEETQLARVLGLSAAQLLSDLQAIACAVPWLAPDDLDMLNEGRPVPGGALAVVAPGTGLGEAFLTWDGSRYQAHASEGGHADFAPANPLEAGLLSYLQERFGHVSFERVCSGMGLPNIYAYLKDSGYADEPAWLAEQLAAASDPTPVIVNAALSDERPSQLCLATLDIFFDPGQGDRQSGAQGAGNWRGLSGRRHSPPHLGCSQGRKVYGVLPAQRAHVVPGGPNACSRHPQPQGGAAWRCLLWLW